MKDYFWLPPSKEFTKEPITPEKVEEAEEKLGVKLPQSYIDIITVQNGGYIRYDTHPSPVPTLWAPDHVMVDHIMGIGADGGILDSPDLIAQWKMPENIVLLSGHGHYWVCLDYRASGPEGEPSVVWIDNGSKQEVELAANFEEFLENLVHGYHSHVFGFAGVGNDPSLLLQKLEKGFGFHFTKGKTGESYYAYYPDWRALDRHSRASLLITPNRSATEDYRYPMNQDSDWLLICNIDKEKREIVEEILARDLPYKVVLIHVPPWE